MPTATRMEPTARSIRVNGITLGYWEWPSASRNAEPPLLFSHATGFHGRTFGAVIEHFPDRHVLSLDLRGHGRSSGGPISDWRQIFDDVTAFAEQLQIREAIGVGHSMGAHSLLQVASENPGVFSHLVLFDPVILAPEFYSPDGALFTGDPPHPTIRRKRDFPSVEAMMERFRERDPYSLFEPKVFEDYCRFGLSARDSGDGYELSCSPEVEASVYGSSRSNPGIHEAAREVDIPVLIVRAKQLDITDFKSSPTWPKLASIIPQGSDLYRPDMTHFHPFQDPADAARIITSATTG